MSGLTEVGNDAQFRRHAMHTANFLRTELESYLQYKSCSEWVDEFRELQIPCSEVFTIAQRVQFASDIGLEPIQPAGDEQIPTIKHPVDYSRSTVTYEKAPPKLNDDAQEILAWIHGRA